ncbi:MAG: ParB/RepB/Spo0J family partition protein, partial [Acutalibacteraceae bacterium]|nr:ParB/RepB/Spo0J family partition protein [Acutalibacteraceae bacterium]
MKSTKKIISIDKLRPFENHPYKVQDNEEMEALAESIKVHGIVSPVIVRPLENTTDEYEIISGHRRVMASRKAGIKEVPALVVSLDRDAAAIVLVDSNLHREHILPSEKAFAYKMKLDAMKHQGWRSDLTSPQVVAKSRTTEMVGADTGDSHEQVRRYIRLTNLIPEILQYVDDGRISFTPAVELSY